MSFDCQKNQVLRRVPATAARWNKDKTNVLVSGELHYRSEFDIYKTTTKIGKSFKTDLPVAVKRC
uniref:Uncharacterized protein n=1 Tax=Timema bartmani TaxID=61472 RepID=A0A7R9F731_9NEOP|nr:unnamed protein product [Timema bartmani]